MVSIMHDAFITLYNLQLNYIETDSYMSVIAVIMYNSGKCESVNLDCAVKALFYNYCFILN